ncbi:hypothetical protein JFL47_03930 [Haemophilus haemoglobinophilus]|nr:hypothetical protein [Canicola haemoglobinophilus]
MKNNLKLTALAIFTHLIFQQIAYASVVRNDVDYQYFRDFAENKGKFTVGATNIAIHNKNGELVGIAMRDVPMPDLSAVVRDGFAAAIFPQYISSVKHNTGYGKVQFGGPTDHTYKNLSHPDAHYYDYIVVDRNDFLGEDKHINSDYHLPRLHKLITEIEPAVMTSAGRGSWTYLNKERFPSFARVGAGTQGTRNADNVTTKVAEPYRYLIGGTPLNITRGDLNGWADASGSLFEDYYGPLANYAAAGDSGSPLWVFDKQENRWVYYAALRGGKNGINGNLNSYIVVRKDWNKQQMQEDIAGTITNNGTAPLNWTIQDNAISNISNGSDIDFSLAIHNPNLVNESKRPADPAKNHGKTVYFSGQDGVLRLMQNLNQGAGALYFDTNFTVEGDNDNIEWTGAGVSVAEGKQVVWKLKNPANDRLSKIGKGTLLINGQGDNQGDISIGDGTVIFNQQNGKAFNKVGLVSGRPTLILNSSSQIDPNNLYFGFRGGRLDLNGNSLTFPRIQNVDEGARIVNNNATQTASITVTSAGNTGFNGYLGETDTSKHNGRLDVNYRPSDENSLWLLSGGTALNGSLNVESGQLMLSGRPTPHAYDFLNKKEVIIDDDWINRNFNATNINVTNNASLWVGRNVSQVNANFTASQNAKLNLGFQQGVTPECIRSDYTGQIFSCQGKTLEEKVYRSIPTTKISGNVNLADNSKLALGKTELKGHITTSPNTEVQLYKDAHWIMADSNTIDNLILNEGSRISLNSDKNNNTNILTINKSLSGNGLFHFATHISNQLGNKILVKGTALGHYQFDVQDQGAEPDKSKRLTLLSVENGNLDNQLNVSLYNKEHVDLGTYRYHLIKDNQEFYLFSPVQAAQEAEAARIAEEKRQKEAEAARIAEEKRQKEAEEARITEEKRRKEEEETRLAEEKRKQETEAARIAAEERKLLVAKNTQADLISASANAAVSEFSSQINALLHINSYLDRKLTEKQNKEWYFWSRVENQKMHNYSDLYRSYQQNINLQQMGIEKQLSNNVAFGALYSLAQTKDLYADNIVGKRKIHQLSMYLKKYWTDNFFSSIDIGYAKSNNKIDANKFNRNIWSFGANLGYGFNVANVKIQPHLGLRYYLMSSADYAINELNAKAHENVLAYHAGISISKVFQYNELSIRPEFTSYYVDANHKSANIESNDIQLSSEFNRQLRNDLNVNLQYKNMNLNLGFGLGSGSNVDKQRLLNLQFGYTW